MLKKENFKCIDGFYYIGDIVDMDGNPWVEEHELEMILSELNSGYNVFELKHPTFFVPLSNDINNVINFINLN